MSDFRKVCLTLLLTTSVALLFCTFAAAQDQPLDASVHGPADPTAVSSPAAPDPVPTASPAAAADPTSPVPLPDTPSSSNAASDSGWRGQIAVYGWFAGVHGTVGVAGHDAGFKVPFSDLFHYLKGIIPVAAEVDKGRFVMPVDFLWMKLGDDKGIPFDELGQSSVNIHITQSLLTPKFGYRLVDTDRWKVDALAGIRYWHVGENLALVPSGRNRGQSANWVDGLGGARIQLLLTPRVGITVSGDAGGGGANLDYQLVGLLNYRFTEHLGLGLGWRYLDIDYHGDRQFLYDTITSGALAGFYYTLGGKPPVPPTATCSVAPIEVYAGEPVTATINTQNFNPKHTLSYKWSSTGGSISGTGTTGNIDTAGLAPGSYTVSGTATDEKEKKNNAASCNTGFTVKAKPMNPPQVSCSANPATVQAGTPSTITATAKSPDPGVAISGYSYTASAGTISGAGTTATLDTATITSSQTVAITVTATDSRNLTNSSTCSVGVEKPPPPPSCNKANSIQFPDLKRPWRVDNTAKAILDDVASRLKSDPNAKIVIVGYADGEKAPMVGTGKNRHAMNLAAQRAVNAKAYLVQQQGVDSGRVEVRQGTGQQQVADIMWVPQGADENACADLQNTTPVDESVVQPSENAYPKPRTAAPAHHHAAAGAQQ